MIHCVELRRAAAQKLARSQVLLYSWLLRKAQVRSLRLPSGEIRNVDVLAAQPLVSWQLGFSINWGQAVTAGGHPPIRGVVMNG